MAADAGRGWRLMAADGSPVAIVAELPGSGPYQGLTST
jgi:hypothetical protein